MKILFCCQFYSPSVGGVQEVIRQIAERLVRFGHEVTVATTQLPNRKFDNLNGVRIRGFNVSGNWVAGMSGELETYREFVQNEKYDLILIYAAQQWTFDALWSSLDKIDAVKVFIPCGFAGLYEPGYREYFSKIGPILDKFDSLVFNATQYRDIDFVRSLGLSKVVVIPNGANEEEFEQEHQADFRRKHGIDQEDFLFLTVGSFTGLKGHQEVVDAFDLLVLPPNRRATLIMNGNEVQRLERGPLDLFRKTMGLVRLHGLGYAAKQVMLKLSGSSTSPRSTAQRINEHKSNKHVIVADLPRDELVQAFMAADLFVFASQIEYSPLVLFESAAAGTPFLTVDVGNALEIARWTGAGIECPSRRDQKGYTRVGSDVLATHMQTWMGRSQELKQMGALGKQRWLESFTWIKIAAQFEAHFQSLLLARSARSPSTIQNYSRTPTI